MNLTPRVLRFHLSLLFITAFAGESVTAGQPTRLQDDSEQDRRPLVILLGDSIRMNYQDRVIADLQGRAHVWAPQENCRHSRFSLDQLEAWIGDRKPQVVHINIGLHDMFLSASTGKPRHDIRTYASNLRRIFDKLRQQTGAKIIFATTTPVHEGRQEASRTYGRIVRRSEDVTRYNAAAREVATDSGVTVNDLYALAEWIGPERILRESDGIHLSELGQLAVGRQVAESIATTLDLKSASAATQEEGFQTIFNGRDLHNWDHNPAAWEVHAGSIRCTGAAKEKNWIIWRGGQPANFILRMQFRWDGGNSGVQVRSDDLGDRLVFGYQMEVAEQSRMGLWHHSLLPKDHLRKKERHLMATAGQNVVIAEDGSKVVSQEHPPKFIQSHFKEHGWNQLEIIARDATLIQKVNGVVFATVTDRDEKMSRNSGFIALQDHGKGCKVAFRNIRLKALDE